MASYLAKLTGDLAEGVKAGIITAEQSARLAALAEARQEGSGIRGVIWIAILAGLSIVAGVSLIVAHNWADIPAWAKVAAFVLLLAGTGEASQRLQPGNRAASIPVELLWFFLPLLGIGLYAQVFQLSGDPVRPFLVWLLLTLPLAWWSPHPVAPTVHALGLLIVLIWGSLAKETMLSMVLYGQGDTAIVIAWTLCLSMLAWVFIESRFRLPDQHRTYAIGGALLWILLMTSASTPLKVEDGGMRFLGFISAAVIWVTASAHLGLGETEKRLPRLAWLAALYAMTFLWHAHHAFRGGADAAGIAVIGLLSVGGAAAVVLLPPGTLSPRRNWQLLAQAALLASLAAGWALTLGSLEALKSVALAANLLLLVAGAGFMYHGALGGSKAQINAGVGTLFLVLVTRFVDVFGSMQRSGFAFIAAGLVLVALAYGLHASRKAMLRLSESRRSP